MSETVYSGMNDHGDMHTHCTKIISLKNQFHKKLKENPNNIPQDLIGQMRIIHGCAIYDNYRCLTKIDSYDKKKITDQEWIKLSTNASLLHVIHVAIRSCEKSAYNLPGQMEAYEKNPIMTTTSDMSTRENINEDRQKSRGVFRPGKMVDDEILSIRGIETSPSPPIRSEPEIPQTRMLLSETFKKIREQNSDAGTESSLTNIINNLNTSDVKNLEKIYSEQEKSKNRIMPQFGGAGELVVTKPTVILYYADRCSFSEKFKKEWEEFKTQATKEFPDVQVTELNVGTFPKIDPSLAKLGNMVGVRGYPTIVLFAEKYKNSKSLPIFVAGNQTSDDVIKFVKNNLNN